MIMVVMVVMVMVRMVVTTDRDIEGERDNSMWQLPLFQLLASTKPAISVLFKPVAGDYLILKVIRRSIFFLLVFLCLFVCFCLSRSQSLCWLKGYTCSVVIEELGVRCWRFFHGFFFHLSISFGGAERLPRNALTSQQVGQPRYSGSH